MSIPNNPNKIKGEAGSQGIDKFTFVYLFVIISVALCAFGLGRLSVEMKDLDSKRVSGSKIIDSSGSVPTRAQTYGGSQVASASSSTTRAASSDTSPSNTSAMQYVASKRGKLYYKVSCAGAKRIKEANKVWFVTPADAVAHGYTASTCI